MRSLTTPRLILRPLEITDVPAVQAGFPRWEIVRHLDAVVPWPYPPDGALTYIGTLCLPGMQRGEEWHWSIRPRSAPTQLIGVISFRRKPGDNRGFWLDPAWQGRGLMSEACEAATDYWFRDLNQPVLQVVKAAENDRIAPDVRAQQDAPDRDDHARFRLRPACRPRSGKPHRRSGWPLTPTNWPRPDFPPSRNPV